MQEAFAESLEEATRAGLSQKPKLREQDAKARREKLLDEDKSRGPPNRLWRFRSGQKCHELRKLIAQISFGIELLIKGMANNNAQVLTILQGHIDEVDEFLETAMEDVRMATTDLKDRLDFLKVPMTNMEVFEQMLENRKFRLQIVEGNIKIEHILSRTSTAHTQTIRDVAEGLRAVKQFSEYLRDNDRGTWRQNRPDVVDVFDAMKGNTEGWMKEFTTLESSSTMLSGLLVQLSSVVVDIDKKAGEVSRRTRFTLEPYSEPDSRSGPRSEDSTSHATPPPSPPTSVSSATPRIRTLDFGHSLGSFLAAPESPGLDIPDIPVRARQRITKDSDTLRNTMLPNHTYTPPESSKKIPEVVVDDGSQTDGEAEESGSVAESQTSESTASSKEEEEDDDDDIVNEQNEDENVLFLLQPRTYTPVPPAPIPSPRASPKVEQPPKTLAEPPRLRVEPRGANRGTPDELSIHIEAEEDMPQSPDDDVCETVLTIPHQAERRRTAVPTSMRAQPKILQIQPVHRQSRSSDKEVVLGHKTSLRERVSLKGELPTAIHVPPVHAYEIQRPRYPTPQQSPRAAQRAPSSSHGTESDRSRNYTTSNNHTHHSQHHHHHNTNNMAKHHTTNLEFSRPQFPNLISSPASERQHFRPVQASPHSPLQQRPHTAGTVVGGSSSNNHRPGHRGAPSQMAMSMLSNVTTMQEGASTKAGSTRTVKKKRSAFGWLKKAFSLDEEERAAFEARRRAQPANYYQYQMPGQGHSPRYLDGKRIA
ncbi:hypothetical protein M406DRAFT_341474 [Cryphonectria parasitica EP155]|uniref:Uncharacterized protein n=1 Tax=Cryphonectria parasitica (strain ATCC 38755 / EP155) TaxID=660469 RepID=A0A9P4XWQ2_CRYP1|nr:uncharacterized protein M406DRAFT_341474 [Cryphonectria parasitica EP155]KAF3762207.1 hypothetical protein M406DRAFT_341474 [Cryphonectria parasitica EP155]